MDYRDNQAGGLDVRRASTAESVNGEEAELEACRLAYRAIVDYQTAALIRRRLAASTARAAA